MSMFISLMIFVECRGAVKPESGKVNVVIDVTAYKELAEAVGAAAQKDVGNAHVVVWFSGIGRSVKGEFLPGLTQRSFDFYKPLPEILTKQLPGSKLFLCDLLAWRGFQNSSSSFSNTQEQLVSKAKDTLAPDYAHLIEIIRSNGFFSELFSGKMMAPHVCENIITRRSLYALSEQRVAKMSDNQRLQLMKKALRCNIDFSNRSQKELSESELAPLLSKKTPETIYSAMQYLEGLWVARELARRKCEQDQDIQKPVNIMFLLPYSGDIPEYKYYCVDEQDGNYGQMFRQDFCRLIEEEPKLSSRTINIYFYGFNYNSKGCIRPYLCTADDSTYKANGDVQ